MDAKKFTLENIDEIINIIQKRQVYDHFRKVDQTEGTVLKLVLYKDARCEVSSILLLQKTKIKEHSNPEPEWYYIPSKGIIYYYPPNTIHLLENNTDEWMTVISIKKVAN